MTPSLRFRLEAALLANDQEAIHELLDEVEGLETDMEFLRWRDAQLVALLKETSECKFPDCSADCPECPASRSIDMDRAEYAYLKKRDEKND